MIAGGIERMCEKLGLQRREETKRCDRRTDQHYWEWLRARGGVKEWGVIAMQG